jgi:hypothetical protein
MQDFRHGHNDVFEAFIDRYSSAVFSALAKLTGLTDQKELEELTVSVFVDLWAHSEELFRNIRPVGFIYKVLLQHVFSYLKRTGRNEKIEVLKKTLLIDPSYYINILESGA